MKRDMDLVRSMLLFVEEHHQRGKLARQPTSMDGDIHELGYHRDLLVDEGYLAADLLVIGATFDGPAETAVEVTGLTWKGHDLLDVLREEKTWTAAITENPKIRNMPLEVISSVLTSIATRFALGGP